MHSSKAPPRSSRSTKLLGPPPLLPRLRHAAFGALLLGGVLGAAACADQIVDAEPGTSPSPAVPQGPAHTFAPTVSSAVIASPAVTIPGTNTENIGAQPWTLIHTFAHSGWYEVRTIGEVHYEPNPAAETTGCGMYCVGVDASPAGTGDVGGEGLPGGELRMELQVTAGGAPYYNSGQYLEPTGDGQLTTVFAVGSRVNLYAARHGIAGVRSCGSLCPGYSPGPTGKYLLTAQQNVEIREVIPLQVQPNKPDFLPGETLTFTTQAHRYVGTQYYWFWVPASVGGYGNQISCGGGGPTCAYAPPGPGHMKVLAYMNINGDNFEVEARTGPITNTPPKLILNCPASVTRGDTMDCIAGAQGGQMGNLAWTFTDTAGHVFTPGPGPGPGQWGGRMVTPGRMILSGTVAGIPLADTADIAITGRTWNPFQVTPVSAGQGSLPTVPTKEDDLGQTVLYPPAIIPEVEILDGPNKGWIYIPVQPGSFRGMVNINNALSDASNPWYQLQTGGTYSSTLSYCTAASVAAYLPRVEVHEGNRPGPVPGPTGYPAFNPPYSHVSLYANIVAQSNVEAKIEELVDYAPERSPGWSMDAAVSVVVVTELQENPQVKAQHVQWLDGPSAPGRAPIDCILRY